MEYASLRSIYLFSDFEELMLKQTYLSFEFREFHKGDFVYKEGNKADCLFIIKEGIKFMNKKKY